MHVLGHYGHHDRLDCLLSNPVYREFTDPPCAEDQAILDAGSPVTILAVADELRGATEDAVLWLNIWAGRELFILVP